MGFNEKCEQIKKLFASADTPEKRYQVIIDLGKRQKALSPEDKCAENLVIGCQSQTYIKTCVQDGLLFFDIESDALISAGLGQLLTRVYSGEQAETVLQNPPKYLEELGLRAILSPGRANGLLSMWRRIQQEALAAKS